MITLLIVSLIAAVLYLFMRNNRQVKPLTPGPPLDKKAFWLLIGLLSIVSLLYPRIRDKINELRQKHQL
jgi:hypothetical protein